MRALLVVPLLAGCMKQNPDFCPAHPDDPRCNGNGSGSDSGVDDSPDAPTIDAPPLNLGNGNYAVLVPNPPTNSLTLPITIDTSGDVNPCSTTNYWVSQMQAPACFVVAKNITINAGVTVEVEGTRPLVLIATDTLRIAGTLDVSSQVGGKTGPAANDAACVAGTLPATSSSGGGGGAGGSFKTAGGNGGRGNNNGTNGGIAAAAAAAPTVLRSGCPGQTGGTGGNGGPGGAGGGAVYVLAGMTIDLSGGTINASGAGGSLAGNRGGGGGGGSGGMIVLSAAGVTTDGTTRVVANGGGGSSGANGSALGGDPNPATPGTPASGGAASGGCANQNGGGTGFAGTNDAAVGGSVLADTCGGGGGGGGAGWFQSSAAVGAGMFSPQPVIQ